MTLDSLGWDGAWADLAASRDCARTPARVISAQRDLVTVDTGGDTLLAAPSGRLLHDARAPADLPAVGDWVLVDPRRDEGRATIHAVLPRRTALSRRAAGDVEAEQVLAANVDLALVVTSMNLDLNPRRVERMLAQVGDQGVDALVVLTKADLCDDPAPMLSSVREAARGAPVVVVQALQGVGLDALREALRPARTGVALGSSGVGKSTLLNALLARDAQATLPVREADHRGRHTTTHRELFRLPGGGAMIDTPGVRELRLWDAAEGVDAAFDDVTELAARCRFRDCGHGAEPGCAVRAALAEGALSTSRYESWRKLAREAEHQARRGDKAAESAARRRWKAVHMDARAREAFARKNR